MKLNTTYKICIIIFSIIIFVVSLLGLFNTFLTFIDKYLQWLIVFVGSVITFLVLIKVVVTYSIFGMAIPHKVIWKHVIGIQYNLEKNEYSEYIDMLFSEFVSTSLEDKYMRRYLYFSAIAFSLFIISFIVVGFLMIFFLLLLNSVIVGVHFRIILTLVSIILFWTWYKLIIALFPPKLFYNVKYTLGIKNVKINPLDIGKLVNDYSDWGNLHFPNYKDLTPDILKGLEDLNYIKDGKWIGKYVYEARFIYECFVELKVMKDIPLSHAAQYFQNKFGINDKTFKDNSDDNLTKRVIEKEKIMSDLKLLKANLKKA